jgi:hypothetical protein
MHFEESMEHVVQAFEVAGVAILAIGSIIVVVRTFLSFSLEIELEGVVPWRKSRLVGERAEAAVPP